MAVKVQILQPEADGPVVQEFTANGTALCLAGETITVRVLVVALDFSSPPVVKPGALTTIAGVPGVNEWTATFVAGDGVPDVPYAVYALAYDTTNTLVAEADVSVGASEFMMRRKRKKNKKPAKKK